MKRLLITLAILGGLSIGSEAAGQQAYLYRASPAACFPLRNAWRRCTGQPLLRRAYPVPQRVQYQPAQPQAVYHHRIQAQPICSPAPRVEQPIAPTPAPQPAPRAEKRVIIQNCPGGICRRFR